MAPRRRVTFSVLLLFSGLACKFDWRDMPDLHGLPVLLLVMRHSHTCVHDLSHHSGTGTGALDLAPFQSSLQGMAWLALLEARTVRPVGPGHALMRS